MTGAEQTPQERLAEILDEAYHYPAWTPPHEIAAAILDSDVIREIKAEAWDEGAGLGVAWKPNPYREANDE